MDQPLCSSTCLETAFIAISVHCMLDELFCPEVAQWFCSLVSLAGVRELPLPHLYQASGEVTPPSSYGCQLF